LTHSGAQLEASVGFYTGIGPTWARSQRVVSGSNLTIPMSVPQGRGLCPSCGGKTAAKIDSTFYASVTLQIANGSVTSGNAATQINWSNYLGTWNRPLQPIQLLTKP